MVDVKTASTNDHGEFDPETKIITLSKNDSELEKINTLIHECFHAILYERGITTSGGFLYRKDIQEEIIVNQLTNGFITLLKDNPKIKKIILGC